MKIETVVYDDHGMLINHIENYFCSHCGSIVKNSHQLLCYKQYNIELTQINSFNPNLESLPLVMSPVTRYCCENCLNKLKQQFN